MKILFVLNTGFDKPGPSNHLLEGIIEGLLFDGYKVHIIQRNSFGEHQDIPASIYGNSNLTYENCNIKTVKKTSFIKRYLTDLKYAFLCLKHYFKIKKTGAVFLQSCNTAFFQVLFLKLIIRKPVVYNVQDIFPINASIVGIIKEKSIVFKMLRGLQRYAYKMSDKIITISEDMKNTIINEGISDKKIDVIHNWSYSDELIEIQDTNNKFLIENNISESYYKIVYAGNIGALQNIDIIMESAKILKEKKDIFFYIIGEGVLKEQHVNFAKDNNLKNVIFYPLQPSIYAPHIYSMANINIIPLDKGIIKTALPSKTASCLSCGKPIIACVDQDSEFGRTINELDKCSVIDSHDPIGLANTIADYYDKSIKGKSIEARNLFKEKFSKTKNVNKYIMSIKDAANNNK